MNLFESDAAIKTILLDIEGTTTPVDFVYQKLFPYARQRMPKFLSENIGLKEIRADVHLLHAEWSEERLRLKGNPADLPDWPDHEADAVAAAVYADWLMEQDRKSTGLKSLQGKIWQDGFLSGELRGEVYPDVPAAMQRWREQGTKIAIFSSGSILAQQLLFGHSMAGDLTELISNYFDTNTGPKREAASYQKIAEKMAAKPETILFLSDVLEELDAAEQSGMKTALSVRPGMAQPPATRHPIIFTFDQVFP